MPAKLIYTVLNWGLGHATRSTPLIEALVDRGLKIEIASSGQALKFLNRRFPFLHFHEVPDIPMRYGQSGALPSLLKRALKQQVLNRKQQVFFKKLVEESGADYMISDNVYGAANTKVKTALITHQLSLKTPVAESLVNGKLASWINSFDEVWIPDFEKSPLSGDLSQNKNIVVPTHYIGLLSRFAKYQIPTTKKYGYGALLGGPEPQRTIFERKVIDSFSGLGGKKIIFLGSNKPLQKNIPKLEVVQMGDGLDMAKALSACEFIVARSGFSSLSDLLFLNLKGLVVPTPGQSEQIYLAQEMRKRGWFQTCTQGEFDENMIRIAKEYHPHGRPYPTPQFEATLDSFLS